MVDSGHEDEITSVPVAAQQVEVFTKVLMTTIQRTIDSEPDDWQRNIQELVVRILLHGIILEKKIPFSIAIGLP